MSDFSLLMDIFTTITYYIENNLLTSVTKRYEKIQNFLFPSEERRDTLFAAT